MSPLRMPIVMQADEWKPPFRVMCHDKTRVRIRDRCDPIFVRWFFVQPHRLTTGNNATKVRTFLFLSFNQLNPWSLHRYHSVAGQLPKRPSGRLSQEAHMTQLATWLSVVVIVALPMVGCGKNRSPVSPSSVTQSGSGFSGSTETSSPDTGTAGSHSRIEGLISEFSGGASAFQFRLGNRLVRGDGGSKVIDGSRTRDGSALRNGLRVGVDGIDRGDHVYATTIALSRNDSNDSPSPSNPNPSPSPGPSRSPAPAPGPAPAPTPESNDTTVSGVLGSVSGTCPALVFPINGSVVVTNSSTVYAGGSCRSLVLGARADVQGTPNGGVVVAREIRIR
jgi:Domain of unknown function (DUF5666)